MILYIFPEAGLVLFMSLYQWVGIAKITILDVYILFTSQRSTWSRFTAVTAMLVTLCETFSTWIFFAEQSHLWGGRALTLAGQSALQCEILMLLIGDDEMATCSSKATSSIFHQLTGLVCVHSLWTVWREEKSLFRSLHQLGIVSWMSKIMIMVRDTFYWWSRRWWRWWRCWVTGRQIRHSLPVVDQSRGSYLDVSQWELRRKPQPIGMRIQVHNMVPWEIIAG